MTFWQHRRLALLIVSTTILLGVVTKLPSLRYPLTELHDFRQTQTAGSVWLYDVYGFHPFRYHVPMFGGKYWMLELPVYQSIVYGLTQIFGSHDYLGRSVSLMGYILGGTAIWSIGLSLRRSALTSALAVVWWSILPINHYFYRAYIPDPLLLSLSLAILAIILRVKIITPKITAAILLALIILFLAKPTTMASLIFPIGLAMKKRWKWSSQLQRRQGLWIIVSSGVILLVTFGLWRRYISGMNSLSITLHDGTLRDWYLGLQALKPTYYATLFKRLYSELTIIGVALAAVGATSLWRHPTSTATIFRAWGINLILYLVIFNNLNIVHNYYQLPLYPLISIFIASGLFITISYLAKNQATQVIAVISLLALQIGFQKTPPIYLPNRKLTDRVLGVATTAEKCTSPQEKIVLLWPGADPNYPTYLYYSHRIGYNQSLAKLNQLPALLQKDTGITSLVFFQTSKTEITPRLKDLGINFSQICYTPAAIVYRLSPSSSATPAN